MTNIGNVNRDQIEAAAKALKDQSVPIPGGRYLAAAGVYQTLNTEDKILSVEIEKQDGTVAALRLILAQMAAAKKVRPARARVCEKSGPLVRVTSGCGALLELSVSRKESRDFKESFLLVWCDCWKRVARSLPDLSSGDSVLSVEFSL